MSLLGIDVGTSSCKTMVVSNAGTVVCTERADYAIHAIGSECYEITPQEVWNGITACIQKCNTKTPDDPISALAVSTQGEAVIPLDTDGRALANAPISSDMRGRVYLDDVKTKLDGRRVFELTGQCIDPIHTLFKLMWWRDHDKELFRDTWKYVCFDGYTYARMGLPPVIDETVAARTMLFDVNRKRWSNELLSLVGLDEKKLPEVAPCGTILGRLTREMSSALGFSVAPVVVSGSFDQACAALGAGVYLEGASYSIGTTECIALVSQQRIDAFDVHVPTYPHCGSGSFVSLLGSQNGARLFAWMNEIIHEGDNSDELHQKSTLYEYIRSVRPSYRTDIILVPHLAGSGLYYGNPNSKGIIYGLTLQTRREDLLKAALEGISFEQSLLFHDLLNCCKSEVQEMPIRAIGGGSALENWLQIKADIFQEQILKMKVGDASCLGAVMLAGTGTKVFASMQHAIQVCVSVDRVFEPDGSLADYYAEQIARYRSLYRRVNARSSIG